MSGLCYLVCLQGAWNEIMKTLFFFPLSHICHKEVFDFYVLPYQLQHKVCRDYQSIICFWKLSFTNVSGYNHSLSGFLTFLANQITLRQERKHSKKNDQEMQPKLESKVIFLNGALYTCVWDRTLKNTIN